MPFQRGNMSMCTSKSLRAQVRFWTCHVLHNIQSACPTADPACAREVVFAHASETQATRLGPPASGEMFAVTLQHLWRYSIVASNGGG